MKINKNNYYEVIRKIDLKTLPVDLQEGHALVEKITEDNSTWEYYNISETIRITLGAHFDALGSYLDKGNKKPQQRSGKPARKSTAKSKKSAPETSKKVHYLSEEIKFIKRFIGIHNKRKTPNAILNFIKALQKAITARIINKDSLFKKEIEIIQDQLISMYNRMKGEMVIELEEKLLARLVGIAGGEEVYPSISFIRSYINMQGKPVEEKRKNNFLKRLAGAVNNKKILSDDPFADKLKKIYKDLQELKTGKIKIDPSELNGLKGICSCCDKSLGKIYDTSGKRVRKCKSSKYSDAGRGACSYNKGLDNLGKIYDSKGKKLRSCKSGKYSDAGRGACSHNRGLSGVMTAKQVSELKFDLLPFTGEWERYIGQPEKNFTLILHGEPGAGKSTFLIQFAEYLARFGRVLYVSSEEYRSVTLTNLVNRLMSRIPENVHFSSSLAKVDTSRYDAVIIDSGTDLGLTIEEFKLIQENSPQTAFVLALQQTKSGTYKGGKSWEHLAQIQAEIINGTFHVYKNRYGKKGDWNFLQQENYY